MRIIKTTQKLTDKELSEVIYILKNGGMVVYPTDTAYGLGVLVSSKMGVDKLLEYKGSRGAKAVSVAVAARNMAEEYVELNELARELYQKYLPGKLTIVSKLSQPKVGHPLGEIINYPSQRLVTPWVKLSIKSQNTISNGQMIDPRLVSSNGTLGIRIPDHVIPLQITDILGKGITATSANVSGGKTPYSIALLLKSLPKEKLDLIDIAIDYGVLPPSQTSTIVDATEDKLRVIREGEIKL